MEKEKYIKALDMRNNRVVFVSEARWPEYRASGWFDRLDECIYVLGSFTLIQRLALLFGIEID